MNGLEEMTIVRTRFFQSDINWATLGSVQDPELVSTGARGQRSSDRVK